MSERILAGLNPRQREAVMLPRESALVLAGAGSGKTRVLTARIAWLIHTGQASPSQILAVTFTNKAAREMLERITALLPINPRSMWVGTFHGLCHRLLRTHFHDAGLPQAFQIIDQQDQLSLIKRMFKALGVDDEKYPPRQLQQFINAQKESGLRSDQVETGDDFTRHLAEYYAAYQQQCDKDGLVDFAELLLRSHELLRRHRELLLHYRERFSYVLVDEFQDTNRLQYDWLKLISGGEAVFAVGDDDQSIYAFRGANAANMRDFAADFGARTLIKLEQNYRSQGNILDAANALIRHNSSRLGKDLWTVEGSGEPLRVYKARSETEEAAFVVEEMRGLVREGLNLSQVAILYRSNAQSRALEHALFAASLPYRVYGGLRFFERQEVKHALAYLRLVAHPDDDPALLRIINFPTRGIGARTIEQLQGWAHEQRSSLWAAARGFPHRGVAAFIEMIDRLKAAAAGLPLPELIEHAIEVGGLAAHYRAEREGAERLENLGELVNAGASFVAERQEGVESGSEGAGPASTETASLAMLVSFLAHAALEAGEYQAAAGTDAIQLMTVHAAKGLEFHTVFITGLEQGLFPHENSLYEHGGLEEERRLMYVAITRARRRLYLSSADTRMLHGQTRYNLPSAFFREIPRELLKQVGPVWEGPAAVSRQPEVFSREPEVGHQASSPRESVLPPPGNMRPAWRIGQSVRHGKFGLGVIVNAEGQGSDARVLVNFKNAGMKWLALEYAKLVAA